MEGNKSKVALEISKALNKRFVICHICGCRYNTPYPKGESECPNSGCEGEN